MVVVVGQMEATDLSLECEQQPGRAQGADACVFLCALPNAPHPLWEGWKLGALCSESDKVVLLSSRVSRPRLGCDTEE